MSTGHAPCNGRLADMPPLGGAWTWEPTSIPGEEKLAVP
jgi:hypothetical protein